MTVDQILECLERERVRATYGAVGEVIGLPAQSVGRALGPRRPRGSWVVSAANGLPSGYAAFQMDPHFTQSSRIIRTGDELRRFVASRSRGSTGHPRDAVAAGRLFTRRER